MGPVIQQVVRGNGRSNIGPGLFDELDRIGGGDMFEYYLEVGEVLCDSREFGVDNARSRSNTSISVSVTSP